jgi:hypothetical protein
VPANDPNEVWRPPPELEQPLPRRVRLNGIGIAHCLVAVACLAFGVYEASQVINDELRRQAENESLTRQLAAEGQETVATVTHLYTALGHAVGFEYTIDGRQYKRGALISAEHWRSLHVGSPLTIRYMPSDPSKACPAADPPDSQNHWSTALPMAGMILFFMLSIAAGHLAALFPKRRLLARGQPVRGTVTRCRKGGGRYFLDYDFSLPDGRQCQGKAIRGQRGAEGSAVTVLYDRDQPRRNTIYPLGRCVWELAEPR